MSEEDLVTGGTQEEEDERLKNSEFGDNVQGLEEMLFKPSKLKRPLDQKPICVTTDRIRTVTLDLQHQPRVRRPFKK